MPSLSEKLGLLRNLEGHLRGLNRPLAKSEIVRLIHEEQGATISQAYLSQIESGKRPHLTEKTRNLLAKFFRVHPGYLVSDPKGYRRELTSMSEPAESCVDDWLNSGALTFSGDDAELADALRSIADHHATRELLILLGSLCRTPDLIHCLGETVRKRKASGDLRAQISAETPDQRSEQ